MRRSVGSEILRMATVLSVPAALACVLPFEAFSFRASEPEGDVQPLVAFVTLNAEQERAALRVAKSSLREESTRVRRLRADLSFGELPEEPVRPVLLRPERESAPPMKSVAFGIPVYRPAQAAAPPLPIARAPASEPKRAFSRADLLKIDEK